MLNSTSSLNALALSPSFGVSGMMRKVSPFPQDPMNKSLQLQSSPHLLGNAGVRNLGINPHVSIFSIPCSQFPYTPSNAPNIQHFTRPYPHTLPSLSSSPSAADGERSCGDCFSPPTSSASPARWGHSVSSSALGITHALFTNVKLGQTYNKSFPAVIGFPTPQSNKVSLNNSSACLPHHHAEGHIPALKRYPKLKFPTCASSSSGEGKTDISGGNIMGSSYNQSLVDDSMLSGNIPQAEAITKEPTGLSNGSMLVSSHSQRNWQLSSNNEQSPLVYKHSLLEIEDSNGGK
jgi:hypothetical protein